MQISKILNKIKILNLYTRQFHLKMSHKDKEKKSKHSKEFLTEPTITDTP